MRLRTLGSGGRSRLALAAIPGMLDVDYNLVGHWSALLPLASHGHRTRLFDNQEQILCSSWPFPEIMRNCGILDKDNLQQVFPQQTIFKNWPKIQETILLTNVFYGCVLCILLGYSP